MLVESMVYILRTVSLKAFDVNGDRSFSEAIQLDIQVPGSFLNLVRLMARLPKMLSLKIAILEIQTNIKCKLGIER